MIQSFRSKDTETLARNGDCRRFHAIARVALRKANAMIRTKNLIHPGEILKEEFLDPMGISQNRLALDLHVPAPRVNGIVRGKRAITADTAVRLGVYFGTGPEFWQNLQSHYDLCIAQRKLDSERFSILPFLPHFERIH